MRFELRSETIDLDNLLKACGIASSGSEAADWIRQGRVYVNGEKESRLRRKLRKGDRVRCGESDLEVI